MIKERKWIALLLAALMLAVLVGALAEGISTTVVMRVSRMTRSAIVNIGEDLSLEVNVDGVVPASYQWYFGDAAISGANQRVYNIVNAQVEDSGVYRLEAFDENGRMLVSMEISARVIDPTIPKSGDASLPLWVAVASFALAAGGMVFALRKRVC